MLEYNVYIEDFNAKCIETFNIFNHWRFLESLKSLNKKNKERFLVELDRELRYYFWSKCEWEIILSDWPPSNKFNEKKISVYDQVRLNWPIFSEYVWENRGEI